MKRSLRIRYALFSMMLLMVNPASFAQRNPVQGGKPDPQLSQSDNDFIDRQDALFLDSVQTVIKSHPPVAREGKDRGYAKLLLDAVFHDKYAAFRKPVVDWFHRRGNEAISGLESKTDPVGMRIWKIYCTDPKRHHRL
ncbi:MAG: hypothetical protein LWW85_12540 [Marinilabiliales bacterium]|nr:hypothetical protein [Marinilabiliales bacterium]